VTVLDSRSLRYVDTFGRHFTEPGRVRYRLTSAAAVCLPAEEEHPFAIDVGEGSGGRQHDVVVALKGRSLRADPPSLEIAAGDVVLWHCPSASIAYAVQGDGAGGSFDSTAMTAGTLYTHAFGTAGDFEWTDAVRGAVSGMVRVTTLDGEESEICEKWMGALSHGALVTIHGDRVDPPELSVLAGQTVFFAVTDADGISITEGRLAEKS
jgi:plastocyanin